MVGVSWCGVGVPFSGGSVMVWGGNSGLERTLLVIVTRNLTAQCPLCCHIDLSNTFYFMHLFLSTRVI